MDNSKAKDLKSKLDKKYPKSVYSGKQIEDIRTPRIRTGSFVFDMLTGGGIPKNRITVFHGTRSSSKSTFAQQIAGRVLKIHKSAHIAWIDFEHSWDWEWARHFIHDKERVHVVRPDYSEEGVDIAYRYATEADDIELIVIDSLGGIIPASEIERGATEHSIVGSQVKLINKLIRKLIVPMSQAGKAGRELTTLAVNQIRANMDLAKQGGKGSPHSQPGGKFLGHACSLDIKWYQAFHDKPVGKIATMVTQKFSVDKNKVGGIPKRNGQFGYYIVAHDGHSIGEIEETEVIITYAKRSGIIRREGNKWIVSVPGIRDRIFKLRSDVREAMNQDTPFKDKIKKATLKECLKQPLLTGEIKETD